MSVWTWPAVIARPAVCIDWRHVGLPCLIRAGIAGRACGYVGVFPESRHFGVHRSVLEARAWALGLGRVIYAGLTTAELDPQRVPAVDHGRVWWVGIDPLSARDDAAPSAGRWRNSRDVHVVRQATERLAEELAGLVEFG